MIINKRLSKRHQKLVGSKNFLNSQNHVLSESSIVHKLTNSYIDDFWIFQQIIYNLFMIILFCGIICILPLLFILILIDKLFKSDYAKNIADAYMSFYNQVLKIIIFEKWKRYVFCKDPKKESFLMFKK